MIDYKVNNPLSEAEYAGLAAIVRALKPIQLGSEKFSSRDVTLLSAEGACSVTFEEHYEQNTAYSLKLKDLLISRLNERRQNTLIWLVKHIKSGNMHSTESRSLGHSDTDLVALPTKSVLLSAAKRLYDENCDNMSTFSDSD